MLKQKNILIIAIILALAQISQSSNILSCLDNDGNDVDWWVLLKMPNDYNDGTNYYYYDSTYEDSSPDFSFHESIIDPNSPILRTIKQIENVESEEYASVFWSDSPSTGESVSSTYAHSKGIIGAKDGNGFIISHSTPKFPIEENGILQMTIAEGQRIYGQHFFCVNVDFPTINQYAKNLQLNRVFTFLSHVPTSIQSELPELSALLQKEQAEGTFTNFVYNSRGNQEFVQFAKSRKFIDDFYLQVVSKHYDNKNFNIESWGRPLMDATCEEDQQITGNLSIHITDEINYSYTKDHSKYGISTSPGSNIVCFSDLNRMTSQDKRGGGANCFEHTSLYNFFNTIMKDRQECQNNQEGEGEPRIKEENQGSSLLNFLIFNCFLLFSLFL